MNYRIKWRTFKELFQCLQRLWEFTPKRSRSGKHFYAPTGTSQKQVTEFLKSEQSSSSLERELDPPSDSQSAAESQELQSLGQTPGSQSEFESESEYSMESPHDETSTFDDLIPMLKSLNVDEDGHVNMSWEDSLVFLNSKLAVEQLWLVLKE